MVDTLSPKQRSERMSRVRGKDTKPEMLVRKLVHGMGYRYRLHRRDLPGIPDLVFAKKKKVIFIHGCFWHRHGDPNCKLARLPKSRLDFWVPKLERNRQRDAENQAKFESNGWKILIVWECEVGYKEHLKNKILAFLKEGTCGRSNFSRGRVDSGSV